MEKSILVMGIGNVLLTDEGVGVRAALEIENRFMLSDDVEILDGGTAGIELLSYFKNREYIIIIDAMKEGHPPGSVFRLEGDEVPAIFRTRISPHQLGLSDLLAAALLTGEMPDNLVLFGVEPEDMEPGLELTQTVEASLDKLLDAIITELISIGCTVEPKEVNVPLRQNLSLLYSDKELPVTS